MEEAKKEEKESAKTVVKQEWTNGERSSVVSKSFTDILTCDSHLPLGHETAFFILDQ